MAYVIFSQGIPIVYYGTEQGFNGPADPNNRESLWPHYNTDHQLYKAISTMAKFRNSLGSNLYNSPQIERYVDDNIFAFTRSNVFIATTNVGSGQSFTRTITYHPYPDGTKLVNQLDPSDTVTVNNGNFQVYMQNGLPKVYYPSHDNDADMADSIDDGASSNGGNIWVLGAVVGAVVLIGGLLTAVTIIGLAIKRKNWRYHAIND
jgi:alpha-amylase